MVLMKLERLRSNTDNLPHLAEALACLDANRDAAPGRYEFPGGFILLQEGETKPLAEGDFEAHRKYLDVQILLAGEETIMWADLEDLKPSVPYDAGKDKEMFAGDGGAVLRLKPGCCYVCWPEDGHKACRHVHNPARYRKAVVKLEIS